MAILNDTTINGNLTVTGGVLGQGFIDLVYPVGSIYMSVNDVEPNIIFGGQWEKIKGRFLLGSGEPDDNTHSNFGSDLTCDGVNKYEEPVGTRGGAARHALTEYEMPSHIHKIPQAHPWNYVGDAHYTLLQQNTTYITSSNLDSASSGGNASHNNMPPFLAVNMWKRIK